MTTSRSPSTVSVWRAGCAGSRSGSNRRRPREGNSLRILLIEDDAMNVELFEAALETDGHEIMTERDGAAGEARASDRFNLILLDIQLPKKDGLAVCRSLRARGLRMPIVALSASVLPEEIARAKSAGFDE